MLFLQLFNLEKLYTTNLPHFLIPSPNRLGRKQRQCRAGHGKRRRSRGGEVKERRGGRESLLILALLAWKPTLER